MNAIIIGCIYSYLSGLLLCLYAGMRLEREKNEARLSARVIRPVNITIVENVEVEALKPHNLNFPNTESNG